MLLSTRHPASLTASTQTMVKNTDWLNPHSFSRRTFRQLRQETVHSFTRSVRPNETVTMTTPIGITEVTGTTPVGWWPHTYNSLDSWRCDAADVDNTTLPFRPARRSHLDPSHRRFTTRQPVSGTRDIYRQSASMLRRHSAGRHHRTRRRGGQLHHSARPHLRRR